MLRRSIAITFVAVLVAAVLLLVIFPARGALLISRVADGINEGSGLFYKPLAASIPDSGYLTQGATITLTNNERIKQNLLALQEDKELDAAAEAKLEDMFTQQYFEHVSPQGNGPGYVVSQAGYSYLVTGENLAMGNFTDDSALLAAWMASPGHRANILNTGFVDIGVAVGQGVMNGQRVWLAVQEFGAPSSECPTISVSLKSTIDTDKTSVANLTSTLDTDKSELAAMPQDTNAERSAYNQKIVEYNLLANQYALLAVRLKTEIDQYNADAQAFNSCLNKNT